jgi:chaperone modulatory protein CbpM
VMRKELLPALEGRNLDEEEILTLGELCRACAMHADWVISLVEEGVLEPAGREQATWRFSGAALRRARIAVRLQRDLEINLAGVGLALDLLEDIETLRRRLQVLEPGRRKR